LAKEKGGVNKNSEVLQGTLDLMILKTLQAMEGETKEASRRQWRRSGMPYIKRDRRNVRHMALASSFMRDGVNPDSWKALVESVGMLESFPDK